MTGTLERRLPSAPVRAPARPAARPEAEHYAALAVVRTLAMLSIVAYHVDLRPLLGVSFGISALQIVMCALVARSARVPRPGPFASRRARRLLLPFASWAAIYAGYEVLLALRHDQPIASRFDARMLVAGTSYHLWFLPWAFLASLLVLALASVARGRLREPAIGAAGLAGAALVYFGPALHAAFEIGRPFHLWIDGAGAIAYGFALGRALSLEPERRRAWVAVLVGLSSLPWFIGPGLAAESDLWARYAVALPVAALGFLLPLPRLRALEALSQHNLGVYAAHVLVLHVLMRVPALWGLDLGWRIALVYGGSLALVHALRRAGLRHVV